MSIEGIFACLLRYFTAVVSIALVLAVPTTATADLITLKLPGIHGRRNRGGAARHHRSLVSFGQCAGTRNGICRRFESSKPTGIQRLMIHKRLDRSSPALFLALVKGSLLGSGVITFLRTDQGGFTTFFTITLTNVLLTKFQTGDSENGVLAGREQINLNYERIELKDEVTGQSACWNIPAATAC